MKRRKILEFMWREIREEAMAVEEIRKLVRKEKIPLS